MSNYENIHDLDREIEEAVNSELSRFDSNNPTYDIYDTDIDFSQRQKMQRKNEKKAEERRRIPDEVRRKVRQMQIDLGRRDPNK